MFILSLKKGSVCQPWAEWNGSVSWLARGGECGLEAGRCRKLPTRKSCELKTGGLSWYKQKGPGGVAWCSSKLMCVWIPALFDNHWLILVFVVLFCFILLLGLRLAAHGSSRAGGHIGAVAARLHPSHSTVGSELSLRPTPQLTAMLHP